MLDDLIYVAEKVEGAFEDQDWIWPPPEIGYELDVPADTPVRLDRALQGDITITRNDEAPDYLRDHTRDVLGRRGLDVLAFYRSYHRGKDRWGIYVLEHGVDVIGRVLGNDDAAFHALWLHEFAHHVADVVATTLEADGGKPAYLPHLRRAISLSDAGHPGWCLKGEALANGYMLDHLDRAFATTMREWSRTQPKGYRDGYKSSSGRSRLEAAGIRQELIWHLLGGDNRPAALMTGSSHLLFDQAHWLADEAHVPVYWVPRAGPRVLVPRLEQWISHADVDDRNGQFRKQLARLRLEREWANAKSHLAEDTAYPGLRFKKLHGEVDVFSIRLGRGYRALLKLADGQLTPVGLDKRSDVYRRT